MVSRFRFAVAPPPRPIPKASATVPNLVLNSNQIAEAVSALSKTQLTSMQVELQKAIDLASYQLVVYNVNLSPVNAGSTNVLLDRRRTQASFYIGEPNSQSAVPPEQSSVNQEITKSADARELTVTLSCAFCDDAKLQKKIITYTLASHRSTNAIFDLMPDASASTRRQPNLIFEVTGPGGVLYDTVVVPVSFAGSKAQSVSAGKASLQAVRSNPTLGNVSPPPNSRKADLTISCSVEGNTITIQLQPGSADLASRFNRRHLDAAGEPRRFHTGMSTMDLADINGRNYLKLVAVMDSNPSLQRQITGNPAAVTAVPDTTQVSPTDKQALVKVFFDMGAALYRKLFVDNADPVLRDLMVDFDRYDTAGHSPLIRIETQSISLPWQFLHPPGLIDSDRFWGLRYELTVDPLQNHPPGYYPAKIAYGNGPLVFAKYHAEAVDSPADQKVADIGDQQASFLAADLGMKGVLKVDSRQSFLDVVKNDRSSIEAIVVLTHATSRTALLNSGSASVPVARPSGPELLFRKEQNEFVNVDALSDLMSELPATETEFLKQRPIVILNGCETGTGGFFASSGDDFPSTFLTLGARGVLSTEAPVWVNFAKDFGSYFMRNLKSSPTVSGAVLQTRKQLATEFNNPLGLLYSYYGGVDAAMSWQ